MKVQIGTIEVGDDARRALAHRLGKKGLATRKEIQAFVLDNGVPALRHLPDPDVIPSLVDAEQAAVETVEIEELLG